MYIKNIKTCCRVTFFRPSPRCIEPQTSELDTMNLQRVSQRAGLQCMDNDHHSVPHGPSLPERIGPRHDLRSFFWCLWCVGGVSSFSVSLYSLFIVVFFLLNGVPRVGTCPISPSLQLLGVVVRTEKYGRVRHKALNVIMAAFPLDTSVFSAVLFCFSVFPALWNDMECHYQWQVASFILGYIHAEEDSPHGRGGAFPSHDRGGVFFLGWAPGPVQTSTWAYQSFTSPQ